MRPTAKWQLPSGNCPVATAQIILDQGGDYVFALKGNPGPLHDQVREMFDDQNQTNTNTNTNTNTVETQEYGHGRSEWRPYTVQDDPDFLNYLNPDERGHDRGWHINSVIRVERKRQTGDVLEHKVHYYISSLPGHDAHDSHDADLLARCIRSHWGIDNSAHWILDVTFREDLCRVRTGFGPENLASLRHMALNFLKRETSSKKSINRKRFAAALDPDYLITILQACMGTTPDIHTLTASA